MVIGHIYRYPFLSQAREWVRSRGITMDEMLSRDGSKVLERALRRVRDSIEGSPIEAAVLQESDREVELLSYPVARYMVAAVGDPYLIKWFSHREGERAGHYMEVEEPSVVKRIGEEIGLPEQPPPRMNGEAIELPKRTLLKGIRPGGKPKGTGAGSYWVKITDYLPPKRNISGPDWDIVNMRMIEGKVELNRSRYIRLLQELVKSRTEKGLDVRVERPKDPSLARIITELRSGAESRRKKYSPTDLGRVSITRLPPCMRQILGMSQAGENMPHHARFALVTFLNAIGLSKEDILNVFSNAPDFKEDIVRYQVDHITGTTSATKYSVPNCETMKSSGICFNPDGLCAKEWLTNPMKYYRIKGKKRKSQKRPVDNTNKVSKSEREREN